MHPLFRFFLAPMLASALLMLAPAAMQEARAQSPACQQIRAELASLGPSRPSGNTGRLRRELGRVQNALAANDCYRSRGFLGLGELPAVCAPLKAQAGQLQAQINAMEGGGSDARRAQLMAAWQRSGCDAPQRVETPRPQQRGGPLYATPDDRPGILERLFGNRTEVPVERFPQHGVAPPGIQPFDDSLRGEDGPEDDGQPRRRRGGAVAVCVRTCDGFFFPVNFEGLRARDEYDEVCKTLCPAAETRVFFMSYGGSIEDAAARDGEPYTALPNARKYQEDRNSACICKQTSQTWASVMKDKTDLVEMRKGDILVSPEQAQQMSRPKDLKLPASARQKNAPENAPQADTTLPAKGQQKTFVDAEGGVTREVTRADGSRATVRNVAPALNGQELRRGSGEAKQP